MPIDFEPEIPPATPTEDLETRQNRLLRERLDAIGMAGEIQRVMLAANGFDHAASSMLAGIAELVPASRHALLGVQNNHLVELSGRREGLEDLGGDGIQPIPLNRLNHPAVQCLNDLRHRMIQSESGEPACSAILFPLSGRLAGPRVAGGDLPASHLLWISAPSPSVPILRTLDLLHGLGSQAGVILSGFQIREDLERTYLALQVANQRLQRDIDRARRIQETLLPGRLPTIPGTTLAARYLPAEKIGGDSYDCFPLDPSKPLGPHALLVADVSGHGIAAAMVMAMFRALLRREAALHPDSPSQLLESLNTSLLDQLGGLHFVTTFLAYYDPDSRRMVWTSAGHPPQLLLHPDGTSTLLRAGGGCFLGAFDEAGLSDSTTDLNPGDTLIIYTDGLTEAEDRHGELYGQDALLRQASWTPLPPVSALLGNLMSDVDSFRGNRPLMDDVTLLGLQVH